MSVYEDLNALLSKDLQVFSLHLLQCVNEVDSIFRLVVNEWNVQVLQRHWLHGFGFVEKLIFDALFGDPYLCQKRAVFSHCRIFLLTLCFDLIMGLRVK